MRDDEAPPAKYSLKDQLFNHDKVALLAGELSAVYPGFATDTFVSDVVAGLGQRELKQRIAWIAQCLRTHLPEDYRDAVAVILAALPPRLDESLSDGDFGDFIYSPYSHFVAEFGCTPEDLELSVRALREITMRFSAEYSIRAFITAFPDTTLAILTEWADDENYHVRRLCSEGTRPSLPWAVKLGIPVGVAIPILDRLHADPTRYVTRSVANHLNDISKTDPALTIATLRRWQAAGEQDPTELRFILRHATRTLITRGHPEAIALWGMSPDPQVRVANFVWTTTVAMGQALEFSFDLVADEAAEVIVDYVVHFQGKAGDLSRRKVFKLTSLSMSPGSRTRLAKRHPLRANMSTRQLYPGPHQIQLQINGADHGTWSFHLLPER